MTNDNKSIEERLAALRNRGTAVSDARATIGSASSAARETLERLASERASEEQEAESHRVMAQIAEDDKNPGVLRRAWNAVKGSDARNPNNLYGLGRYTKAAGDAIAPVLSKGADMTGLTWAFNKANDLWHSSPLYPIRWAYDKTGALTNLATSGTKKWIGLNYAFYNRARVSHDDDGKPHYHPGRAVTAVMASLMATSALAGAIYETPILAYEGAVYAATARTENFILNGVHSVPGERDIYLTGGCPASEKVCTEQNTIQFRIKPSSFMWFKEMPKGHWWRPETVAMAIPNQTAHCQVEYAGARWKMMGRAFDIYPYIVDVKCQETAAPVSGPAPAPAAMPS